MNQTKIGRRNKVNQYIDVDKQHYSSKWQKNSIVQKDIQIEVKLFENFTKLVKKTQVKLRVSLKLQHIFQTTKEKSKVLETLPE